MASITIRNLKDEVKQRLRVRAARQGRSMEEEAREILSAAVTRNRGPQDLARAIRERIEACGAEGQGGSAFDIPKREPMREPPQFG